MAASTEAALRFRFDHLIVILYIVLTYDATSLYISIRLQKTAMSHSSSEARGPAQARGPGRGPISPMPKAGSDCSKHIGYVCMMQVSGSVIILVL